MRQGQGLQHALASMGAACARQLPQRREAGGAANISPCDDCVPARIGPAPRSLGCAHHFGRPAGPRQALGFAGMAAVRALVQRLASSYARWRDSPLRRWVACRHASWRRHAAAAARCRRRPTPASCLILTACCGWPIPCCNGVCLSCLAASSWECRGCRIAQGIERGGRRLGWTHLAHHASGRPPLPHIQACAGGAPLWWAALRLLHMAAGRDRHAAAPAPSTAAYGRHRCLWRSPLPNAHAACIGALLVSRVVLPRLQLTSSPLLPSRLRSVFAALVLCVHVVPIAVLEFWVRRRHAAAYQRHRELAVTLGITSTLFWAPVMGGCGARRGVCGTCFGLALCAMPCLGSVASTRCLDLHTSQPPQSCS